MPLTPLSTKSLPSVYINKCPVVYLTYANDSYQLMISEAMLNPEFVMDGDKGTCALTEYSSSVYWEVIIAEPSQYQRGDSLGKKSLRILFTTQML